MELTRTQTEILGTIRKKLLRGDIKEIASKTNLTREYVGKCLNSDAEFFNQKIVNAAVELFTERERSTNKFLETLTAA